MLQDRKAIVTGAGGGIGRAIALRFASEGADVAVLDIDQAAAARIAVELRDLGCRATPIHCDVSSEGSVREAVANAAESLNGLDLLVTCAGVSLQGGIAETSLDLWNLTIAVNLTGTFLTVKHSLPYLERSRNGSIVTLGSLTSIVAGGRSASYDASKGGVLQFTRAVAVEEADRGIRANCVCPGGTDTQLRTNSLRLADQRDIAVPMEARGLPVSAPMGRAASTHEIAGVVTFLCSEDASFITGAAIPVDGGYTAI